MRVPIRWASYLNKLTLFSSLKATINFSYRILIKRYQRASFPYLRKKKRKIVLLIKNLKSDEQRIWEEIMEEARTVCMFGNLFPPAFGKVQRKNHLQCSWSCLGFKLRMLRKKKETSTVFRLYTPELQTTRKIKEQNLFSLKTKLRAYGITFHRET